MSRRHVTAVALVALLLVAAVPGVGQATVPWFSGSYTKSGGSCGTAVDPVNMVFKGTNAWASDVARNMRVHANMPDTSGSTQSLLVNVAPGTLACRSMDRQRATGPDTRTHARLWRIPSTSGASKLVAGSAHYEQRLATCLWNHAVLSGVNGGPSGFDIGRQYVLGKFQNGGHVTETGKDWGNTHNFRQCDGTYARSDGYGVVIYNNHRH